ncbi:MAG: tetratricopeptide repeat protein, partial [Candidatus Brocadiae bacterium]|nr:tetratricopeptide repeat protein [Candidatus Brocadiia bacterium]
PVQLMARDVLIAARLQIGQEDGLLDDCDALIGLQPERAASFALRAAVRRSAGDAAGALGDCDTALGLNPSEISALLLRSKIRGWTGNLIGAMADAEIACRLKPEAAEPIATRAYLHALFSHTEEAERDVQEAFRRDPEEPMALVTSAWIALARLQPRAALDAANRAVDLRPALPDPRLVRLRALYRLGRNEEALADADWVLARTRYVDAALMRVQLLLALNRMREAAEEAGRMVREWPGSALPWYARAIARRALRDEGWLEDLEAALAADPRMERALETRTLGLIEDGRLEEALKSADAGIAAEPMSGLLRVARARARVQVKDRAGALEDLGEALKLAPWLELDVRCRRAGILLDMGSADGAADELIAALRIDARDVESWRLLGEARKALGNPKGAEEAWRKVLEFAGESDPRRALAERGIRELGGGGK